MYCIIYREKIIKKQKTKKKEKKVRQNLLDSDYEIYIVRLLVTTVNWHKSLQFVVKSNITLLPCLFMILLAVSIIILRLGITFW